MRFVAVLVSHVLFMRECDWRRSCASRVLIAIDGFFSPLGRVFFPIRCTLAKRPV